MSKDNKENPKAFSSGKSEVAKREEEVLKFWQENDIFKKSEEKEAPNGEFVFYDGPPFATGLPHYGHILAGTIKDVLPRYQTMKGKKVTRRWGWDCHGLPVENLIEDELGLKTKKDIYEHGIEEFNQHAKDSVLRYDEDWKKIIPRTGRWVDMDHSYKTMDTSYSESIWWIFKNIYDKKLIYEGHKSMHLCPRCETTLSNFEVNQGYKDITDISVTAKFELVDEPGTFVLAWTTTPWTLPGNVALTINKEFVYCEVSSIKYQESGEKFIVAKERLNDVFKDDEYTILKEFKGSELVGKSYKPVFDYYSEDKNLENHKNGWKIYGADFVNTEDGTGVIHIAPAFGEDDMFLGQQEGLPYIQHVSGDGKFTNEVKDFVGLQVKPKDDHQSTDIEIIKNLANRPEGSLLFAKEKLIHSYPHCWRCHTPLLNYGTSSWFLKVTGIKDKLIDVNKKINWVPSNMRDGRFGKWLEGARDWAISRTRFWGAPLPVWRCQTGNSQFSISSSQINSNAQNSKSENGGCGAVKIIGSIDELRKETKSTNNYFVIRHGEAENNVLGVGSTKVSNPHHLTEKGKEQVFGAIEELKKNKIDLIISSPFVRTKETAEIIAGEFGIKEVIFDDRIMETQIGDFEGKNNEEYHKYFESQEEKFTKNPPNGENLTELKNRVGDFIYDIDKKYSDKNILIVTHEYPAWLLLAVAKGLNAKESVELKEVENIFGNAEVRKLDFAPLPHNKNYEVDLHMPFIDDIEFGCKCGGKMKRIPEVFDCWFESGSMPYASNHYPFENLDKFDPEKGINFPADFIAEGLDQTRGWFYTSLVLSTALFDKTSFQNVIVNGTVLAEDGQKQSKSLRNYPDPLLLINKYGADAMRYYLLSAPVVRAEDMNFSEKGVDEVLKKIIMRLNNVYSFYELYKDEQSEKVITFGSENVLDKWILARLNELVIEVTEGLDNYELDRASRPILDFIDDLSTWYLRRSRDRFKGDDKKDKDFALETIRFVLQELSKVMAPFMPFIAEEVYQKVKDDKGKESVHLDVWPEAEKIDENILDEMKKVREIVSLALEARAKTGIKVRQPLSELRIKNQESRIEDQDLINIIKDEVNVKNVNYVDGVENSVELDTEITPELKLEGQYRELLRNIQRMRKEAKLVPSDLVELEVETGDEGKELIQKFEDDIKKVAGIKEIDFEDVDDGEEIKIDDIAFKLKLDK